MSNPVPGLPSACPGVSVGLVLGYPFATQDTKRNSSDDINRKGTYSSESRFVRRAQKERR